MSDDEDRKRIRAEAFEALEAAIAKVTELYNDDDPDPDTSKVVAVDAVLLIGMQYYDEDGDRTGYVNIVPRNGWQPGYITAGLLRMATTRVEGHHTTCGHTE